MTKKEPKTSEMFGFRTHSKIIIAELRKNQRPSELIGEILESYFSGKLVLIEDAKKTKELAELKFRNYKASVIKKEFEAKLLLIRGLRLTPAQVVEVMNNKTTVFSATASKEIIQDDKTLRCFTCGKIIELRAYDYLQVDDYEKHVRLEHDRELYQNEKEQMLKVLGEIEN